MFGIERLALVVGGSMGAQQTYEWAVRFPDKVLRAAPIAGTAQNTPHDFLFTQSLMDAITSDPGWQGGEYSSHTDVDAGLRRHAGIWSVVGLSTEFWKTEFWRGIEGVQLGNEQHTLDAAGDQCLAKEGPLLRDRSKPPRSTPDGGRRRSRLHESPAPWR